MEVAGIENVGTDQLQAHWPVCPDAYDVQDSAFLIHESWGGRYFVVAKGIGAQRMPTKVGREAMLGKVAFTLTPVDLNGGKVFVEGEYWNATSPSRIEPGQDVKIFGMDGLTLRVEPKR